ncbi:EndoU domain-containing protein [Bacillus sp. FSL M8-0052]|uniref:EndoU domain-containing protein n=2 Tax=unclassified Bacillus (in: firmicutes) TaxID=185979 RepID=UPI0028F98DD6|nr:MULTISPECIES: EndoU domain-containing protein [Bacillus]MDU0072829.1 EndoU domain-containing protein [Bacillus sp. IG6]
MGVMLDKLDKRSKLEKEISEVSEHDIKISKLKEKLDKTLDDDVYLKIAKEIGYNNLTAEQLEHVKTIEFWKNPLQATVNNLKDTIDGAYEGFLSGVDDAEKAVGEFLAPVDEAGEKYLGPVYDHFKGQEVAKYDFLKETGEGLLAIGKFGADLLLDPKETINTVFEFDYKKAWDSTWNEVKESWDKNFIHGDTYSRSHYVTYFTLNVASLFVSGGGGAVAKSGSVASKVGKVGKTAGKGISKSAVSGIKKGINGAGKVGQAAGRKVVKDAKEVGELIKKGASKLGQIPNPLARELLLAGNVPINVLQLQKNGHDLIQQIKKSVDHQKGVKGIGKASGEDSIQKTPKSASGGEAKNPNRPSNPETNEPILKVEKHEPAAKKVSELKYKKGYYVEHTTGIINKFTERNGISGGHNYDEFKKYFNSNSNKYELESVVKKKHPDIEGIFDIEYKVKCEKMDYTGKNGTGEHKILPNKNRVYKKTVYDPKIISNDEIIDLSKKAMEDGIKNERIIRLVKQNKLIIQGEADYHGKKLKFEGIKNVETDEIENAFPVLEWRN